MTIIEKTQLLVKIDKQIKAELAYIAQMLEVPMSKVVNEILKENIQSFKEKKNIK
ncbi:MAG: hypothetical protein H8D45_24325 [Bacteroidetes bacterium]|nr:hypothetical protein [Bacteroidota bacterium]